MLGKSGYALTLLAFASLLFAAPASQAVLQGHSPLVIQGHSPIVLLVTDPLGNQIGCTAVPCSSTSSSNFVNTIPVIEGPATYDFATNNVTIANPYVGTWTVEYIGTGGTPSPFAITVTTTVADKPVTLTILSGTTTGSQTGSATFLLNANGTITLPPTGVPEFPVGLPIVVSVLFAGLVGLKALRHKRLP